MIRAGKKRKSSTVRKPYQPMYLYKGVKSTLRTITVSPKKFVTNVSASSTVVVKGAINFQLIDMTDYLSASNVFDQYRITKAKVFFIPQTQPQSNASSGVGYATMVSCIDYDDSDTSSFTSVNDLLSYDSSMIHKQFSPTVRSLIPRAATGVLQTTTVVPAGMANKGAWMDCVYPNVQHYGVKYAVAQCTSTNVPSWDIYVQVWIEFKNKH